MSRFFIDRPIFAWVVALILMLAGALSITRLPITPYPEIAPPTIVISASYPGASAQAVEESVTQIIEQNMTGLDGLIYMTATSRASGRFSLALTFASGSKVNNAQIMGLGFYSPDGSLSAADMSDYIASNLYDQLSRVAGVGALESFGSYYAMRIWLDPERLRNYGLTPGDIVSAINGQNAQFSVGQLGATPAVPGQQINATITARGRLQTPEQFRNIVVRGRQRRCAATQGRGARGAGLERLQHDNFVQRHATRHWLWRVAGRRCQCVGHQRSRARAAQATRAGFPAGHQGLHSL